MMNIDSAVGGDQVPGPLAGVRVIDMTCLGMGPLAAQIMGDLGADVIKLEPPTGDIWRQIHPQRSDNMSHTFMQFNRNKRSISLDLKSASGMEAFRRLLKTGDVFLSNTRPAALQKLGLDYQSLRAIKEDIICCGAYGYSERGPYAGRPAVDDTIQAMSGLVHLQGRFSGHEQFVGSVVADKVSGLTVINSILAALIHRMRTGQGQFIEVPMFETMVAFVMPEHMGGKSFEPPLGTMGYDRLNGRRTYATKDGSIFMVPYTGRQWQSFFELIGRADVGAEDLKDSGSRNRRFMELSSEIETEMVQRTTQEWMDLFQAHDIMFARVNSVEDLLVDPHLDAVGMFPVVNHPTEGPIRLIGFPVTFSETPCTIRRLPPQIGQDSREILTELDFSAAEIARMETERAVTCPSL